jgi:anti-anti-sigma regulatory factor
MVAMASRMAVDTRGDVVYLEGIIDENARLDDVLGRARNNRLILDLAGIRFINSIGVREWIRMQQAASKIQLALELRRVAVPVVHQLNIVPATRGVSMVSSFFAPYECVDCDEEHDVLIEMRSHGVAIAKKQAPRAACPNCGEQLALSTPAELYFSFLGA